MTAAPESMGKMSDVQRSKEERKSPAEGKELDLKKSVCVCVCYKWVFFWFTKGTPMAPFAPQQIDSWLRVFLLGSDRRELPGERRLRKIFFVLWRCCHHSSEQRLGVWFVAMAGKTFVQLSIFFFLPLKKGKDGIRIVSLSLKFHAFPNSEREVGL